MRRFSEISFEERDSYSNKHESDDESNYSEGQPSSLVSVEHSFGTNDSDESFEDDSRYWKPYTREHKPENYIPNFPSKLE